MLRAASPGDACICLNWSVHPSQQRAGHCHQALQVTVSTCTGSWNYCVQLLQDIATLWAGEVQATGVQPMKDYMTLLPNPKEILVHLSIRANVK